MKKQQINSILILICLSFSLNAQQKLKGNKDVTTEDRNISDFTKIEIIDDFEVFLVYNSKQSVSVEADSNLQGEITTEVKNGTLVIKTEANIRRTKALKVHLKVNKSLKEIYAYNNAKLISKNLIIIDTLRIFAYDNVDINLKLNSKILRINGTKSSEFEMQILSDEVFIRNEDQCTLKGTIDTQDMNIEAMNKTSITLKGSTDYLSITCDDDATFKGENFATENAIVRANNKSCLITNVSGKLELFAKNSSEINLYSDPEIIIHEFYDRSVLRKKELH